MLKIVSAHLDDAVLSLGQMLAAEDGDIEIVTVFAGIPDDDVLTDYDKARGYRSSAAAMTDRRAEDAAACAVLGARYRHLPFLDRQYRMHRVGSDVPRSAVPSQQDVAEILAILGDLWRFGKIFVPLGIGHPDHDYVSGCARQACPAGLGMYVYEELPYRVLHPEQVFEALGELRQDFAVVSIPSPIKVGDRAVKEAAIAAYASQFPSGADDPCYLVPERAWNSARQ